MAKLNRGPLSYICMLAVLCGTIPWSVFAEGEGRIVGTVLDQGGNALAGARIVLTQDGAQAKQEKMSSKNGAFSLFVLDARAIYRIHISKEHFLPVDEPIKPVVSGTLRVSYTLKPAPSTQEQR